MQETQFQSLGWEDPLEEELATHSSILAWRIPWTEEPGELQSEGLQRVGHDLVTEHAHTKLLRTFPLFILFTSLDPYIFFMSSPLSHISKII